MITLLYITNGLSGSGGLERVLSIKASYLAEHLDYDVHILTLNEDGKPPFYDFSKKVTMHSIPVSGNTFSYLRQYVKGIRSVVYALRPDVISVCDDGLKGFFLPIILQKPCPMIYERHTSKLITLRPGSEAWIRRILSQLRWKLMDLLALSYERFVVLTNGNTSEWLQRNLHVLGNPLSFYPASYSDCVNKCVIAVGSHATHKGFDMLLHAWRSVNQRYPDWKLTIYGKKDPELGLEYLATELAIEKCVSFESPVSNIQDKYLESSIYVLSSRFEGFGMVLIEAMACGVPCVSFDCPHGPADIITDGVDGILVPPNDVDALAEKLIYLIENPDVKVAMGARARENVRRYLPEKIVPKWDELFRELVNQ